MNWNVGKMCREYKKSGRKWEKVVDYVILLPIFVQLEKQSRRDMALFTGEHECKMDAKGRLALPSRIKAKLPQAEGGQLVLSLGLEPCLVLYPQVEYKKIYSRIAALNEFNDEYRTLQRNFFRRIVEVELDTAGRILIPKHMARYAGLDKDLVVVGMGNRLELWDQKAYEASIISDNAEFSKLAKKHLTD